MDINHLNINELEALNKKVVERLHKLLAQNDKLVLATLLPGMQVQFAIEGKTSIGVLLKKKSKKRDYNNRQRSKMTDYGFAKVTPFSKHSDFCYKPSDKLLNFLTSLRSYNNIMLNSSQYIVPKI